ncbi:putative RNA-binding Zn ribbon-like protein [Nakamurella flavida]|uniref:CGNR zinc finger domain-containing protein n=1 Tax=Nakamurella flavida TaxID=363630 RepID=UPI002786F82B|nr:CGNR zinc finger domain-containing protein [Nakamurella flavida]MDP9778431.1 putative RNA-binding Zn ribbon-like protein [Nakamurella flavida]
MTAPAMGPALAKRFRSGRACLDFAHTAGREEWVEPELVVDQQSLERWLGHVLGLRGIQARPADLAPARRLRDTLWNLAQARIHGRPFATEDVRILNTVAATAPPVPRLTADGTATTAETPAAAALSAVARDAIDLFTGPLADRVRGCAADDCRLMFVDASRPGTRRWCSMERCGNLAKVRTHRGAAAPSADEATPPSP